MNATCKKIAMEVICIRIGNRIITGESKVRRCDAYDAEVMDLRKIDIELRHEE